MVFAENENTEVEEGLPGFYLDSATGAKLEISQEDMTASFRCYAISGELIAEENNCSIDHIYLKGDSWRGVMRLDGALVINAKEGYCLGEFKKISSETENFAKEIEGINAEQQRIMNEAYAQLVGKTFNKKGYQTCLNFVSKDEVVLPAEIDIPYSYTLSAEKGIGSNSYYPHITLDGVTYTMIFYPADKALILNGDGTFSGWYEEVNTLDASNSSATNGDGSVWTVRVESGYLALRTAMAYDVSNEIGALYTGDTVELVEKSSQDYWYVYSSTLNQYGYVNCNYLY